MTPSKPSDLLSEELLMERTAEAMNMVPAFYVRDLLAKLRSLRVTLRAALAEDEPEEEAPAVKLSVN